MKERAIIFSGPMVTAILDGTKTQTRRLMKPQPILSQSHVSWGSVSDPWHRNAFSDTPLKGLGRSGKRKTIWYSEDNCGNLIGEYRPCPYGAPGDRLWVRETYSWLVGAGKRIVYKADGNPKDRFNGEMIHPMQWLPSIFMPRKESRITLDITNIRIERLQDISEDDARAEGVTDSWPEIECNGAKPYAEGFAYLWDQINRKRAPWESNPWVWALTFKKLDQNNEPTALER